MKNLLVDMVNTGGVTVNGVKYAGQSLVITGDKIIVDGVEQNQTLSGTIEVSILGDVQFVSTASGDVNVSGNVSEGGRISTSSGDVVIHGDTHGDIATTSGDIHAQAVGGNASTFSGNIIIR